MVNIRQMIVNSNKYDIKCPFKMSPIGLTIHNTANDASANNEVSYMINNNNEVSFHYAVDDVEIVQGLPLDRNAWHASDGGSGIGNRQTIAIEICHSKSGGVKFDKAEENAADLIVYLLKKYNWGIDKVKRHYDYARDKKYCPHRTMDEGWDRFLKMISDRLNPPQPTQPQPSQDKSNLFRIIVNGENKLALTGQENTIAYAKKTYPKEKVEVQNVVTNVVVWKQDKYVAPTPSVSTEKRYAEKGTFTFTVAVTVRTSPIESAKTNAVYNIGESVVYKEVILNKGGFNWIVYDRSNGTVGYLKIKDLSNGQSYGYAK